MIVVYYTYIFSSKNEQVLCVVLVVAWIEIVVL